MLRLALLAAFAAAGAVLLAAGGASGSETNLIANGSFEGTLAGWDADHAKLSLANDGLAGRQALRAAAQNKHAMVLTTTATAATVAGATYAAGAAVRSDAPGDRVCIGFLEWRNKHDVVGAAVTCVTVTSAWQRFDVLTYKAVGSGDTLQLVVSQPVVERGDSFELDDVVAVRADGSPPETTILSGPTGARSSTSATFSFASSKPGRFECSLDGSPFASCTSPKTYSGLAEGTHVFAVRAVDLTGVADPTPATQTWIVDTTPPDTTIVSGPTGLVNSSSATFTFGATESGVTFACSLDGAAFAACGSPATFNGLRDGSHTLRVRATDAAGNTDPTPAQATWRIDTTPPVVTLTSGPSGNVLTRAATFTFTVDDQSATVTCSLDDAAFATCTSPQSFDGLANGTHTFRVQATDPAGNAATASRSWFVDLAPPETTITSGPPTVLYTDTATFAFASSRDGSSFECSLNGGAFAPCSSPVVEAVPLGSNTFSVRATGPNHVTDPTPAAVTWWAAPLLQNGNFETPLRGWETPVAGWDPSHATLSLAHDGIVGPTALGVAFDGSASSYAAFPSPRPIRQTVAGTLYTGNGFVRSSTPGKNVCLSLREWDAAGQNVIDQNVSCLRTTSAWQAFDPVTYTGHGGTQLELYAFQLNASPGDGFELDGLSVSDGGPSSPAPLPPETGDPTLLAAGDIAACYSSGDEAVSRLLDTLPGTIAALGDTVYPDGTDDDYAGCFDPSWGRHLWRMRPAVGDHEYNVDPNATGYWNYFGPRAGERGKGWYSYDLGSWHVVVLNSHVCDNGGCDPGSEQYDWLGNDLATHPSTCTVAYFHSPRFSNGTVHGNKFSVPPLWDLLYRAGVDVVLGGSDHTYQRFAPQAPNGAADPAFGIRQFVVGTGGEGDTGLFPTLKPNEEVQNNTALGVLKLVLHNGGYDWTFVAAPGDGFTDSGSNACHGADTTAPTVGLDAPAAGATVTGTVTLRASATDDGVVDHVDFLVNGAVVATDDGTAPYARNWDSSSVANGPVTIAARAVDAAGNATTSPSVVVNVSN